MTDPLNIGEETPLKTLGGFRVIANDTSSGRPRMWYCPTLESARLLASTICGNTKEEVAICKMVGVVRVEKPKTEFILSPEDELIDRVHQ